MIKKGVFKYFQQSGAIMNQFWDLTLLRFRGKREQGLFSFSLYKRLEWFCRELVRGHGNGTCISWKEQK